jgi:hypothetical protein
MKTYVIVDGGAANIAKNSSYYQTDDLEFKFNVRKVFNIKTRENEIETDARSAKNNYVNDVSEFVAKVKGGLPQAQRIAKKFDLKLVKKVIWADNFF